MPLASSTFASQPHVSSSTTHSPFLLHCPLMLPERHSAEYSSFARMCGSSGVLRQ